jgi:hypothetical protein
VCTKKTSSIPDGLYGWCADDNIYESIYKLTESDVRDSYAIEVKGDKIQRWTSGSVDYKAKIVEKDGEIYFEGYKWRDIWDILFRGGKESGTTNIYRVIYNETEKSITLILK